jgi:hypothetical protein
MIAPSQITTRDAGNGFAATAHPISNNSTVISSSGSFGVRGVELVPSFQSKFTSQSNFSADTFVRLFAGNAPEGSGWHTFWLMLGKRVEGLFAPAPVPVPPVVPTSSNSATYVPVQDAKSVIESFAQGQTGNCGSIATIKAAIATYGTAENTFKTCKRIGHQWVITMRDDFKLVLSDDEVRQAAAAGDLPWNGKPDSPDDAVLLFAAMAKRAQLSGNDGIRARDMTYATALDTLDDGETPTDGFEWLGLRYRSMSVGEYADYFNRFEGAGSNGDRSALLVTVFFKDGLQVSAHGMFASDGIKDRYGHVESIWQTQPDEALDSIVVLIKDPEDEQALAEALDAPLPACFV